jgi:ABC-type hemin transport system substrate-binding protein
VNACPICKASLNGTTQCRRCRADLQKVQEVEQRGRALAVSAVRALVAGDVVGAAALIERAAAVHAAPTVRVVRALTEAAVRADDAAR